MADVGPVHSRSGSGDGASSPLVPAASEPNLGARVISVIDSSKTSRSTDRCRQIAKVVAVVALAGIALAALAAVFAFAPVTFPAAIGVLVGGVFIVALISTIVALREVNRARKAELLIKHPTLPTPADLGLGELTIPNLNAYISFAKRWFSALRTFQLTSTSAAPSEAAYRENLAQYLQGSQGFVFKEGAEGDIALQRAQLDLGRCIESNRLNLSLSFNGKKMTCLDGFNFARKEREGDTLTAQAMFQSAETELTSKLPAGFKSLAREMLCAIHMGAVSDVQIHFNQFTRIPDSLSLQLALRDPDEKSRQRDVEFIQLDENNMKVVLRQRMDIVTSVGDTTAFDAANIDGESVQKTLSPCHAVVEMIYSRNPQSGALTRGMTSRLEIG